ncbi:MAG: hypothetical protein V1697_00410 [Candidatus Levyibacteriota bacterium]
MPDKSFNFANIVATPTLNSWAQAYNAGKLFAVLSLEKKHHEKVHGEHEHHEPVKNFEPEDEHLSLSGIGKEILTTLEQEYFSLETKSLESIKGVVQIATKKIPDDIHYSFVAATVVDNILYLYAIGGGKIDIKRDNDFGTLLESMQEEHIKSASGYLKDKDLIIIQTKQFTEVINSEKLNSLLDHQAPSDISEAIAPMLHEGEEGAAASVVIQYSKEEDTEDQSVEAEEIDKKEVTLEASEEKQETEDHSPFEEKPKKNYLGFVTPFFDRVKGSGKIKFSRSKGGLIAIAIVLITVFIIGIFLNIQRQNNVKVEALFNEVYPQAQKKYDEGQSLSDLNQNLARESFQEAKEILSDAKDKFPKDSKQEGQIEELTKKVEDALSSVSGINSISAKEVENDASSLLSFELDNSGIAFTTDGKSNFYLTDKSVYKEDKEIIENDDDWNNPIGLGVYFGNIYVLDKTEGGILKFVAAGSGYSKTNYFASGVSPELSNAKAMAIDGSIWILLSDGNVLKYTRGKADNFNISGLDKPFSNATKLFTNIDFDNIYILDNGNSRIVVLGKDGNYKEQYQTGILKDAKDFEVNESDKKILVLSSDKIFQIDLK